MNNFIKRAGVISFNSTWVDICKSNFAIKVPIKFSCTSIKVLDGLLGNSGRGRNARQEYYKYTKQAGREIRHDTRHQQVLGQP